MLRSFFLLMFAVAMPAMCYGQQETQKTKRKAGARWDGNGIKMAFRYCPPGKFMMGSPKDEVHHKPNEAQIAVTITKGFWIGETEVTEAAYKKVLNEGVASKRPVTDVHWKDAAKFCAEFSKQERAAGRLPAGWEYQLPTECQWEYACRAGSKTKYFFGDDETKLSEYAWWGGQYGDGSAKDEKYAHDVATRKPNAWGLHDMHGNVREWCADYYLFKLPGGVDPNVTEKGPKNFAGRVIRGGGWKYPHWISRTAFREFGESFLKGDNIGFRVALVKVDAKP